MLSIGIIGCGLWGPNLARNFAANMRSRIKWLCDLEETKASNLAQRLGDIRVTSDHRVLLQDPEVQAVVIATPLQTHYQLVKQALEAGKHVLVEKPLTPDAETSWELTRLARSKGLVLMTGYVFLFNSAVQKAQELIQAEAVGDVFCLRAVRTNLGPIRIDTNALWDLASHDISMFLYWLAGDKPVSVSGTGGRFVGNSPEDVVTASITFASGRMAFLYASWLDPSKVRQVTVVGSRKMLLFDDMASAEPIRLFDKHVDKQEYYDSYGSHRMAVRSGDILIPFVKMAEPLNAECNAFLDAVLDGRSNLAIGDLPAQVGAVLEAADQSIKANGAAVRVEL